VKGIDTTLKKPVSIFFFGRNEFPDVKGIDTLF